MRRVLKWFGIVLGGLIGLLLVAAAVVWLLGGRVMNKRYNAPVVTAISIPTDSASLAEGERLAKIRGCPGCHEQDLAGTVLFEEPFFGRFIGTNLTRVVREYTDTELIRAIRYGVKPNGRSVLGMPSSMLNPLTDDDLGAIIGYVKSRPAVDRELPASRLELLGRFFLLRDASWMQADRIEMTADRSDPDPSDPASLGRYLALTSCTECHGTDLMGDESIGSPSLVIVAGYSEDQFSRLMRTGVPMDGRELDLMAGVARSRFVHFTDVEMATLYAFLNAFSGSL